MVVFMPYHFLDQLHGRIPLAGVFGFPPFFNHHFLKGLRTVEKNVPLSFISINYQGVRFIEGITDNQGVCFGERKTVIALRIRIGSHSSVFPLQPRHIQNRGVALFIDGKDFPGQRLRRKDS